jgi:glucose/arabinose dehydrogenase
MKLKRRQMKLFGNLLLLPFFCATDSFADTPLNQLNPAESRGGWQLLFDGRTTDGWRNYQSESVGAGWVVKDGILDRAAKGAGDLITVKQYENFELSLEYRISKGGNSGVLFHVTEDGKKAWHSGPEIQLYDNVNGTGSQKSGWLYELFKPVKPGWAVKAEQQAGIETPEIDDATRPAGEWNQIYVRVSKRQSELALNGVSYFRFRKGDADWDKRVAASKFSKFPQFGKAAKGHICLQDHGNAVAFRNIKVRELNSDGDLPELAEEKLALNGVSAFPELQWEGFEGIDDNGKIRKLRPMAITHAGDGSNRLFVGTQRGAIYVFPNDPQAKDAKLFLDIRDQVADWKKNNEEGFLGLAFHPDYQRNGQFFGCYTAAGESRATVVSRFTVSAADANVADAGSEEVLMKIPQPFANHNGGSIVFGHDGYLYIGLGDGGGRNDPLKSGQDLSTLMGSLLRIDVNTKQAGKSYGIPADNPFVQRQGAQPEIYAYGFRNIWRLAVDRRTGLMWAADVGQDLWEEVNIVQRGGNYGWSVREASFAFGNKSLDSNDPLIDPVWEYDHQVGRSITGGCVYRGSRLPELQGAYLYADFVTGRIWALKHDETSGKAIQNFSIATTGIPVMAFGEDEAGEVYYALETADGKGIYRFDRATP